MKGREVAWAILPVTRAFDYGQDEKWGRILPEIIQACSLLVLAVGIAIALILHPTGVVHWTDSLVAALTLGLRRMVMARNQPSNPAL